MISSHNNNNNTATNLFNTLAYKIWTTNSESSILLQFKILIKMVKLKFGSILTKQILENYIQENEFDFLDSLLISEFNGINILDRLNVMVIIQHILSTDDENEDGDEEEYKKIDVSKFKTNDSTNKFSDSCAICQNKYDQKKEYAKLPCGHVYDYECIDKWLKLKPMCPICKYKLSVSI